MVLLEHWHENLIGQLKSLESSLLVQALKSLGETHVDDEVKDKLISWLEVKKSNKILMVSKL